MEIYVVQAGDTLNSIAQAVGVPAGIISRYNGLSVPFFLAVGQSLVILRPSVTYTVQSGDTLYSIAESFSVSPIQLLRNNPNLGGRIALYPGQVLVITLPDTGTRVLDLNGYAYPFVNINTLRTILPYATYLTPFTYGISRTGSLVELEDELLISLAREYGTSPLMHLSTLTETGSFSSDRAATVLSSEEMQIRLADAAVAQMLARGYDGLDVDFEFLGAALAVPYAAFVATLRERVNAAGGELITALAPKVSESQLGILYEGHLYQQLAENSDAVLLMTYEWGYTLGPPMAVAPIASVRRVLDFAVTQIPPEKIFMGFPNYGYDWALPYRAGSTRAISISNEYAVSLAIRYGAEIQFDNGSQTPYFHYRGEDGRTHEVWFEDARSCIAKFSLVPEYGFRGIGYWNFMRPFTTSFSILNVMFQLRKI